MLKIILIEDHALVREGMAQLVRQLEDEVEVLEAATADAGTALLEQSPDLDMVVLDLSLPGMDGLSWLKIARRRFPAVPVVVVSAHDDSETIRKVMRDGASGFVAKASPTDRLLDSLSRVLAGEIVEPTKLPAYPGGIDHPGPTPVAPGPGRNRASDLGLSPRQAEVLRLLAKGKTNGEIGSLLGLTEGTVKIHVTAVFKALGVKNRTQALLAAKRLNIRE